MLNHQMSQNELLKSIHEVSFAVNDMQLYLDTHPHDHKAMDEMRRLMERRKKLLDDYSKFYGPLTMNTVSEGCSDAWAWVLQPWPWETKKGRC